ncbi:MAG: TonB-dependent receptor [Candidatus Electryonea clarkiae]|nr:TonB-dependent receptor [Candidatus Electryonea clarkiae]MDP8285773.1 TonB-dependent receptor [Candidatus Electryonea clarkiae]
MFKQILTILILICVMTSHVFAKGNVRGFVIDATSGEPLPVANVVVLGEQRGSTTNLDGFFAIPNLETGSYALSVSYLGYHRAELTVTISEGASDPVTIELLPVSVILEEVVFTVKEKDNDKARQSARVSTIPIDANTIRNMPSLGAEVDVLRAMQAIPGVKASSDISSALYVRGGSSDMTLIQMDQSTVYNPSHLFGIFSTFNGDAVKHIELMKGAFPAEYGGRAGSVLEVVTNDGNRKKMEGLFSIGLVSARGAIEGPLPNKRGSYALSGRRTYLEPIISMMKNASEEMADLPDYYFYDGNGKVNIDIGNKTTLTVGGYLGQDDLQSEFGPDDSKFQLGTNWGNRTFASRLRHIISDNGFLTLGIAYSRYNSGFDMENDGVFIQEFKNRFRDRAFRGDYEYLGYTNQKIKTGIDLHIYDVEVLNRFQEDTFVNIDTTNFTLSYYIQNEWKINSQFELLPGIRMNYHEDSDKVYVDPRLALLYHYDTKTRLKLAGGRYHQWVNIISFGEGGSFMDIWMPFDGSMDPMYSDQIVFGFENDPREDLEFTVEAYYNKYHNVLNYNNMVDRGFDMASVFLSGEGNAYGFEWMLHQKAGRLTGWTGYSLSWSKRRFTDTFINDGDWYYPKWDRRHDFVSVGTYKLTKNWDMSTSWRYNTGQGYTRALGLYTYHFAHVPLEYEPDGNRTILNGEKNNYRLPADHRLDMTFTYNHKFFGKKAKLDISIYNVYSRRSIWFRTYDTDENPIEVNDVKLLPVLPLISYEVRF